MNVNTNLPFKPSLGKTPLFSAQTASISRKQSQIIRQTTVQFGAKKKRQDMGLQQKDALLKALKNFADVDSSLEAALELMGWDQSSYMPENAENIRPTQVATLTQMKHDNLVSPKTEKVLKGLSDPAVFKSLDLVTQKMVKVVKRDYDSEKSLSADLVHRIAKTESEGYLLWNKAKKGKGNFDGFAVKLQEMVDLQREKAHALGFKKSPYDALLNEYEPGMTSEKLEIVFDGLKAGLVPLIKAIHSSPVSVDDAFRRKNYSKDKQLAVINKVLTDIGYDFKSGRQDFTTHPCQVSVGAPYDARILTNINPNDLFDGFFSSVHEGGHALYEQGIEPKLAGTPLGAGTSLGIHESQSRMWENIVARSKGFWATYLPVFKKVFPKALKNVTLKQFYQALNKVTPSLIRIQADEVTYNLHVLTRFELEKDMIEGKLDVKDLPEHWNQKMQQYLGVSPKNLAEGAFQDVHWSSGLFGYFPTYTLGNLYSAQFFHKAQAELGLDLEKPLNKTQLKNLRGWLKEKIHRYGKMEDPNDIIRRVTGEDLNPKYFLNYLWNKYEKLYQLDTASRPNFTRL